MGGGAKEEETKFGVGTTLSSSALEAFLVRSGVFFLSFFYKIKLCTVKIK